MTKEQQILVDAIKAKLANNESLTDSEEYFYMTEVLKVSPEEADTIITIAENKDETVLID